MLPSTVPAVSKIRNCRWVPSFPDQGSLAIKAFGAVNISTARVLDSMAQERKRFHGSEKVHRVPEKCKATTIRTQPNRQSPATMYVTVIFTYPKNYPSSVGGFYHSQSFSHLATPWNPSPSPTHPIASTEHHVGHQGFSNIHFATADTLELGVTNMTRI